MSPPSRAGAGRWACRDLEAAARGNLEAVFPCTCPVSGGFVSSPFLFLSLLQCDLLSVERQMPPEAGEARETREVSAGSACAPAGPVAGLPTPACWRRESAPAGRQGEPCSAEPGTLGAGRTDIPRPWTLGDPARAGLPVQERACVYTTCWSRQTCTHTGAGPWLLQALSGHRPKDSTALCGGGGRSRREVGLRSMPLAKLPTAGRK